MKTRTKRVIRFTFGLIAAWVGAVFLIGQTVPHFDVAPAASLTTELARALVAGTWAGVLSAFLELKVLPRKARKYRAGVVLLIRTVSYAVVAWLSVLGTARFVARQEMGISLRELLSSDAWLEAVRSPEFGRLIVMFIVASFVINGVIQVSRVVGPGTAVQLLLGRYLRPVEEDRVFLFLDLTDSTSIAERLGPVAFAGLKNDFFHDLAEPVLDTRGQIFQYVGDEAVVTWPYERAVRQGDCVRCFFLLAERIERDAARYEERYGFVPTFKAGLHGGSVVVSEIGDIKKDIVFSGDAVNTAARLESLCRPLERKLLVSDRVMSDLMLPDDLTAEDLGDHTLRGKDEPVRVFSLAKPREDGGPEARPALARTGG